MEKWEIEVKEHWNKISDSEWYQSLRKIPTWATSLLAL